MRSIRPQGVIRSDGRQQPYDHLILATGAACSRSDVPGMTENSETIWGFEDSRTWRRRSSR
ncbi:MAG: hypothetical protein R2849_06810 [Thermomicrobiales bacterium]